MQATFHDPVSFTMRSIRYHVNPKVLSLELWVDEDDAIGQVPKNYLQPVFSPGNDDADNLKVKVSTKHQSTHPFHGRYTVLLAARCHRMKRQPQKKPCRSRADEMTSS